MMKSRKLKSELLALILFMGLASLMSCIGYVTVQPNQEDQQARIVISRTNTVLQDTREAVRGRRVYTGDLAYAYSNQRYAVDLYNNGQYHNAIEFSLYARRLCYRALDANGANYSIRRYGDESRFSSRPDHQLNDDLRRAYPDRPTDDQAVLTFSFNFNL